MPQQQDLSELLSIVTRNAPLIEEIAGFWLDPANRATPGWRGHEDTNTVMLATVLEPRGYLGAA